MRKNSWKQTVRHIRCRLNLDNNALRGGCLGGIILIGLSLLVPFFSGSPYRTYIIFQQAFSPPPLFFLITISLVFSFALGVTCGLILSDQRKAFREKKYQIGMYLVVLLTLWLSLYPLIFQAVMLGLALLTLYLILTLCLILIRLSFNAQRICTWTIIFFACWIVYLIGLLLGCLLLI